MRARGPSGKKNQAEKKRTAKRPLTGPQVVARAKQFYERLEEIASLHKEAVRLNDPVSQARVKRLAGELESQIKGGGLPPGLKDLFLTKLEEAVKK